MRMARKVVPIDAGLKTGAPVPRSGIYSVRHSEHRLPEEVTLLRGEEFPRCAGCESPFLFRLRRELPNAGFDSTYIFTSYPSWTRLSGPDSVRSGYESFPQESAESMTTGAAQ